MKNSAKRLKSFLDELYEKYNDSKYAETDPIFYPHTLGGNTEFVALTSAVFAYGNVRAIKSFLLSLFDRVGNDPFNLNTDVSGLYYRFQKEGDIKAYLWALNHIYKEFGSVENVFLSFSTDLDDALTAFTLYMKELGKKFGAGDGYNFLFADPVKSGAKRLRMFLRWMIRDDEIDFGLWKNYGTETLKFPIDTHILRYATMSGIIKSPTGSKKNLELVTDFFKEICLQDPAKYDFSLSRLGIVNGCLYSKSEKCEKCILRDKCPFIMYDS